MAADKNSFRGTNVTKVASSMLTRWLNPLLLLLKDLSKNSLTIVRTKVFGVNQRDRGHQELKNFEPEMFQRRVRVGVRHRHSHRRGRVLNSYDLLNNNQILNLIHFDLRLILMHWRNYFCWTFIDGANKFQVTHSVSYWAFDDADVCVDNTRRVVGSGVRSWRLNASRATPVSWLLI